jgi:hypothetical protein
MDMGQSARCWAITPSFLPHHLRDMLGVRVETRPFLLTFGNPKSLPCEYFIGKARD